MTARSLFRWSLAGVLALGIAFVAAIFYRSYRNEWREFEPWPSAAIVATPEATGISGLTNVDFPSHGGGPPVAGWYVPSRNGAAVIVAHGVSADRTTMLAETRLLADAGFGVLAFDWPGYGASPGVNNWGPSAGAALVGAVDWWIADQRIDAAKIGALGFSMGGHMLTQVAADEPRLRAVVLTAPVTDVVWQVNHEHRKWGVLSRWPAMLAVRHAGMPLDTEPPIKAVRRVAPRPLLIIAGDQDTLVPAFKVREMFDAARAPKEFWSVAGAGHGGFADVAPGAYAQRLTGFFACHLLGAC